MHKLTRQNDLFQLLLNRQEYSNNALAKQYGCTIKTISRDFENLAALFPEIERMGKQKWHIPYKKN
jgi:predicted DNA-binding transcriptional regulator YafY